MPNELVCGDIEEEGEGGDNNSGGDMMVGMTDGGDGESSEGSNGAGKKMRSSIGWITMVMLLIACHDRA